MTLQQLRQVIAIADSGSLNEAARRLYVSQPNLSSVVKELEKEIGITLFLRSNRGIQLTPEGKQFIGFARQVVEQYALLEDRYIGKKVKKVFSVSAQHYSFAVKAFVETVKRVGMDKYEFAMHETKTGQVIDNVKNMSWASSTSRTSTSRCCTRSSQRTPWCSRSSLPATPTSTSGRAIPSRERRKSP